MVYEVIPPLPVGTIIYDKYIYVKADQTITCEGVFKDFSNVNTSIQIDFDVNGIPSTNTFTKEELIKGGVLTNGSIKYPGTVKILSGTSDLKFTLSVTGIGIHKLKLV